MWFTDEGLVFFNPLAFDLCGVHDNLVCYKLFFPEWFHTRTSLIDITHSFSSLPAFWFKKKKRAKSTRLWRLKRETERMTIAYMLTGMLGNSCCTSSNYYQSEQWLNLKCWCSCQGAFQKTWVHFLLTRHHRDETFRVRLGVEEQTKSIDNVSQSRDNHIIQLNSVIFICIVHIVKSACDHMPCYASVQIYEYIAWVGRGRM